MAAGRPPRRGAPLSRPVEDALAASIKRFGVLVPVTVDQNGVMLDGHHRARIADRLGVKYDRMVRVCDSDDERREIARTLNADRRQLTEEQRRAVVADLARGGHSNYAIAGALGVSEGTIRKDIAAEELRIGTQLKPDRVTGLDGKSRPARRPQVLARDDREQQRAQTALQLAAAGTNAPRAPLLDPSDKCHIRPHIIPIMLGESVPCDAQTARHRQARLTRPESASAGLLHAR